MNHGFGSYQSFGNDYIHPDAEKAINFNKAKNSIYNL